MDAIGAARPQPREVGFAHMQGELSQILTIEGQDIESIELHLVIVLLAMESIEIGDPVYSEQDCFSVDDELLRSDAQRGLYDERIAARSVVSIAGEQTDAIAIAEHDQAIAVLLDLVKPLRAGRNL